ncbi:putative nucleotidyltransferase substrate binding domain-containing protein [Ectothiorhodospira sp. BSL-9]|uniref:putative nucleotidyltransferase substrate binding domain-containing protein n=1 Tax=Ectothiorhodospira sp. BSL-9 TaxID=1442136 RepID=UPI001F0AF23D|nr:putative nucleotidyltransferase substrate binding domain-containing protein [Ectothiorhodospira sp. BSL-9]
MAREALKDSPPRSPLWRLGLRCPAFWFTRARPLDLKRRGIMPIVSLARLLAVAHGLPELHTRERLEATIRLGTISPSAGEELIRAWDLITTLRVRQHARLIRAKRPLDNRVESGEFSADERKRLCRAFAQVRFMQRSIGRHYLGGLPT